MDLVDRLLAGDRKAAAQLVTLMEDGGPPAREAMAGLYPHTGRAHIVGVTGSPGTGKSTLVYELAKEFRARGKTVGIIAVDPSSPFSGGALLGDRIRMQKLSTDEGVFIRSMASRGQLGGLARATGDAIKVLDAFGRDLVMVETVGAGQSEVEIARAAHTVIVVDAPGMGDDIQAIKAGLFEIADIFVVNKADRDGAEKTLLILQMMLDMNESSGAQDWRPPLLKTIALQGEGSGLVADAVESHLAHLRESGQLHVRKMRLAEEELRRILGQELLGRLLELVNVERWATLTREVADRQLDPYTAADSLLGSFVAGLRAGVE
ncbi:MAG TPA: methylmalonyl Co-A mutase-associated GTPase MeaB [Anaerolineae bacterium]|nr:methylmalonyl Co-A mutase-associated GTPase MeaB [Anaerolineae bacterium]